MPRMGLLVLPQTPRASSLYWRPWGPWQTARGKIEAAFGRTECPMGEVAGGANEAGKGTPTGT